MLDVLLVHPLPVRRTRLTSRLSSASGLRIAHLASNLTEAFNIAEHCVPDVVLISNELATAAEFEVLRALFDALEILCVIMVADANQTQGSAASRTEGLLIVREEDEAEHVAHVVRGHRARAVGRTPDRRNVGQPASFDPRRIIMIGASTGGVDALLTVLKDFPDNAPPTMIVQHTGGGFTDSLVKLLDRCAAVEVAQAHDGEFLRHGRVYIAPGDTHHLQLSRGPQPRCQLRSGPPISGHRPSVDALFLSGVAAAPRISAAILTGMGKDGAEGLLALRQGGATTFGQDAQSAVVYGMPRVAKEIGAVGRQLSIHDIGPELLASCRLNARGRNTQGLGVA